MWRYPLGILQALPYLVVFRISDGSASRSYPNSSDEKNSSDTDPRRVDPYYILHLGIIVVLSFRTFLFNLGNYPLQGFDEGLYAVPATYVFEGYWSTLHFQLATGPGQYVPFLEMPPLIGWLQALSMGLLGETAFASRLPSALAGIFTALLIYFLGKMFCDRTVGLFASFVFITTPHVFAGTNAFRQATTDGIFVLLGTAFVTATFLSVNYNKDYFYVIGVLAPLLLLTKSVAAGIFVIALLPVFILNIRQFFDRRFLYSIGSTFLIAGTWFLYSYHIYGDSFINSFIFHQIFDRIGGNLVVREGAILPFMKYPYIQDTFVFWDPWIYFFLVGVVVLPIIHGTGQNNWILLSVWWTISIFVFFIFTGNHPWYILPIYAPGAIIVGTLARDAVNNIRPAQLGLCLALITATLFSPRSPSPWSLKWGGLWGNKPGDTILILILTVSAVLLIINEVLSRTIVRKFGETNYTFMRMIIGISIIIIFGLTISSPALLIHTASEEEKQLMNNMNKHIPDSETLYFPESSTLAQNDDYLTLEFYSQHDFISVEIGQLNTDSRINYTIITDNNLQNISREYRIMGSIQRSNSKWESIYVLKFEKT